MSNGNLPLLNPSLLNSSRCLPTVTCTTFGVVPTSTPSSLADAPCGTVFTVIDIVFGGAIGPSSFGKYFAATDNDVGGPAAAMVVSNLTVSPGPTLLMISVASPIRTLFLSKRYSVKFASAMRLV